MTLAYSYIRFSTAEQAKGDSLRRQIELREKYLEGKNLVLDKTLTMNDLGGSAFNGANAETGAFGTFLEAVSNGKVPRGSFLLVESLDRLSRAPVDFALEMFLGIIRKGVTIVTLEDGKEYSQASLKANYTDLIVSITIMARGHGEALRKSDLISSAWKKKRLDAATTGKVMSKVVPFWLQAKDDRSGFVVVEGKVNLIRRMFELCLDGIGVHSIAKMMNEEGSLSPTGKAWRGANIAKFLRNRAVIGEATFTTFMNDLNKRMETDPIPNYFPAVISESDFYAVRDRFANSNIKTEHGKKSDYRNLFRRKVSCPYCGGTVSIFAMKYKRKDGPQHYTTLYCSNKCNGMSCPSVRWDYYEFQTLFLNYVKELDITSLLGTDSKAEEIRKIQQKIGKARLTREQSESKLNNLITMVEDQGKIDGVGKRMLERQEEIRESEALIEALSRDLSRLEADRRAAASHKQEMNSLIDLLGDPAHSPKPYRVATDDEVRRRAKLSLMINSLVENIQMYSVGFDLKAVARQVELDESKYFGYDKEFRFMVIKFKSGAERSLTWNGLSYKVENGKFVGDAWFGQPWPDIATYPSPSGKA